MNVPVLLFLVDVVLAGTGLTYLSATPMRLEERVGVGVVVGAMTTTIMTFVAAWAFGFDTATVVGATLATSALALAGWRVGARTVAGDVRDVGRRFRVPTTHPESLRPLAVVSAASWAVTIRILALAYQGDAGGGVVAGHLSTYGDWNAHLAYAGSFANGDNVPPTSPIAVGSRLTYHVLVDVFAADVAVLGVPVPAALTVTTALLAMAFPLVFWFTGRRVAGSQAITLVAYAVFTLSGGLGFVYAAADIARGGLGVLGDLPRTYARLPERDIWMDNAVLSFLYAQRPGLIGLPIVLIAVGIVWTARPRPPDRPLVWAGVVTGASAGFSVFGFGGAVLLGGWLLVRTPRRALAYVAPALALGVPVVLAISPASREFRWQAGWMASSLDVVWPWFWLLNVGLFLPLAVVALIRGGVLETGFDRAVAIPVWAIFVTMNLVVLHPWEWNNTHYLIVWQLMIAFPVAALVVAGLRSSRPWWRTATTVAATTLVLSGALDVWRAVDGSAGTATLTDADGLAAADWARRSTEARAVFLTAPEVTEPIASFGARRVVSGYSGWILDLGLDWSARANDIGIALRGEDATDEVLQRYGVDFVVLGPSEHAEPYAGDVDYWDARGELVFANPSYRIYATGGSGGSEGSG